VPDRRERSTCYGTCASVWPPLRPGGTLTAGHGITQARLSIIARRDGTKQVAYNGHPLYYYVGDRAAGQTAGQGKDQFGGAWYLVKANGSKLDSD